MIQTALFQEETKFEKYDRENPHLYEAFIKYSLELKRLGRRYYGAKKIAEDLRHNTTLSGNDEFKINNTYVSYFARKAMNEYTELEGFFRIRKSK